MSGPEAPLQKTFQMEQRLKNEIIKGNYLTIWDPSNLEAGKH